MNEFKVFVTVGKKELEKTFEDYGGIEFFDNVLGQARYRVLIKVDDLEREYEYEAFEELEAAFPELRSLYNYYLLGGSSGKASPGMKEGFNGLL